MESTENRPCGTYGEPIDAATSRRWSGLNDFDNGRSGPAKCTLKEAALFFMLPEVEFDIWLDNALQRLLGPIS